MIYMFDVPILYGEIFLKNMKYLNFFNANINDNILLFMNY